MEIKSKVSKGWVTERAAEREREGGVPREYLRYLSKEADSDPGVIEIPASRVDRSIRRRVLLREWGRLADVNVFEGPRNLYPKKWCQDLSAICEGRHGEDQRGEARMAMLWCWAWLVSHGEKDGAWLKAYQQDVKAGEPSDAEIDAEWDRYDASRTEGVHHARLNLTRLSPPRDRRQPTSKQKARARRARRSR